MSKWSRPSPILLRTSIVAVIALFAWAATGAEPDPGTAPWMQCRRAIAAAGQSTRIPDQLLAAIGLVETGRWDPRSGVVNPWPWTINVAGEGTFFDTKAQAVAAVRAMQAHGVASIDVGCMQVNLMYHPQAFRSLDEAFDPPTNARYAAQFLSRLFQQTGEWPQAAALYHSATPELGDAYRRRVLAVWPAETRRQTALVQAAMDREHLAAAWRATLSDRSSSAKPRTVGFFVSVTPRHRDAPASRLAARAPATGKFDIAAH